MHPVLGLCIQSYSPCGSQSGCSRNNDWESRELRLLIQGDLTIWYDMIWLVTGILKKIYVVFTLQVFTVSQTSRPSTTTVYQTATASFCYQCKKWTSRISTTVPSIFWIMLLRNIWFWNLPWTRKNNPIWRKFERKLILFIFGLLQCKTLRQGVIIRRWEEKRESGEKER